MGWSKKVDYPPPPHKHATPGPSDLHGAGPGSIWECECGAQFEVIRDIAGVKDFGYLYQWTHRGVPYALRTFFPPEVYETP